MNGKELIPPETPRLRLRRLAPEDWAGLCAILQDPEVMYAYEHAFSDDEVHDWLNRQLDNYRKYGFGLWAVTLKSTSELIGQCGLTWQEVNGRRKLEIGYLFRKSVWHRGYATEAAVACRRFAFEVLGVTEVCSIIRENNFASQRVARRNGMTVTGHLVKHYYGLDMPHLVLSARNPNGDAATSSPDP